MNDLITKIAKDFSDLGYTLYEVGGHVRDEILGRESNDIDLTTSARPDVIKDILKNYSGNIFTIGENYGTIGFCTDKYNIEITTFRGEVYPIDSRKPNVVFGNDLLKDLSRRDFTINAIARNILTGELIDPFGGVIDIQKRKIRCIGSTARFNEDPLRMLRAVRFCCQLNFKPAFYINNPQKLLNISRERVRDELIKIIKCDNNVRGIMMLCDMGLMKYIIPDFLKLKYVSQGPNHIKDAYYHTLMVLEKASAIQNISKEDSLILRISALLHDIGKPETKTVIGKEVHFYGHQTVGAYKAERILSDLRFDKVFIDRVVNLVAMHMSPILLYKEFSEDDLRSRMVMRMIRRIGERDIGLLMHLVKCDIRSSANPRYRFMNELTKMVEACLAQKPETLDSPINGNDIMNEFNVKPGKFVGEVKAYLTNLVIDSKLKKGDRVAAYKAAKEYIEEKKCLQ